MMDEALVISKKRTGRKEFTIITEKAGIDGNDNRRATIRHIYKVSKHSFTSRKEVQFEGEALFMLRNEYKMNR